MWLLSTSRAELHYFPEPGAVPGGYAILSHTWSQEVPEQTFQEVQAIRAQCMKSGDNPLDFVSKKIRHCCSVAQRDGYAWVWIDTCCINKESSTELSEAINAMFNWYVLAEVCYAHLEDVSSSDDPHAKGSQFRRARWHTRGWTLQELLAPAVVVFLSADWVPIGTKRELCGPLESCTGIYRGIFTRDYDFFSAPVAMRMYWASQRKTTRVEDEAYCLLGLFNINMPTLYGEGRQAFQRLQLEITKRSLDTTLFAWGVAHDASTESLSRHDVSKMWSLSNNKAQTHRFLLAPSPRNFFFWSTYTASFKPPGVMQPYLPSQWPDTVRLTFLIAL